MYTKGPWTVGEELKAERISGRLSYVKIPIYGESVQVADCTCFFAEEVEMNKANASLIAAAPELLEVLESAMNYINRYGGEVTSSFRSGGWGEYVDSVIRKARGL